MNIKLKEDKGFTLIEVIIAISILTIGMLAVGAMQGAALRGDTFAYNRTNASTLAQDELEKLMSLPYNNMASGNRTTGNYNITWTVTNDAPVPSTSTITVTVTYSFSITPIVTLTATRSSLFD